MISSQEIELLEAHNADLVAPIIMLEKQLERKNFRISISVVDGELQVSVSHKWFLMPIMLFRKDLRELFEELVKPLGIKIKRWFTKGRVVKNSVFVIEPNEKHSKRQSDWE
jgi:hypothetical protein